MIRKVTESDYKRLLEIWESSVLNTHDFLKEEDFLYFKENLPLYFNYVSLIGFEVNNVLVGFLGFADDNIEMLFIDNDYRRNGIGKQLLEFVLTEFNLSKVDVNEQNEQAINFYKKEGFEIINRSEIDSSGKEYPILHMSYSKK